VFFKGLFESGIDVQLATVSMSSPSQANAVLTASGYVVARRKAAVASKGTGTLVYLGVDEGDKVKKGQLIARLDDIDVAAARERARENLRVAGPTSTRPSRVWAHAPLAHNNLSRRLITILPRRATSAWSRPSMRPVQLKEAEVAVDNTHHCAVRRHRAEKECRCQRNR
jgi:multidrug efflux pump subunit AcrA (membrane-fusion protein)